MFFPHPRVKVSIVGSLRDREVACSASDRQGSNFESCVWRTVSSQSSHHRQEVFLTQFSLYVHKGGIKPDSFHLSSLLTHFAIHPHDLYKTISTLICQYKYRGSVSINNILFMMSLVLVSFICNSQYKYSLSIENFIFYDIFDF